MQQIAAIQIAAVQIALIGKPGLFPETEVVEISDLQGVEFITQGKASGYSKSIREWFANYGVNTRSKISVDSLHAMVGLAVAGRGLCIAPRGYLVPLIDSGRIVEIQTTPQLQKMNYCVVHYPSAHEALFSKVADDINQASDFETPYFI